MLKMNANLSSIARCQRQWRYKRTVTGRRRRQAGGRRGRSDCVRWRRPQQPISRLPKTEVQTAVRRQKMATRERCPPRRLQGLLDVPLLLLLITRYRSRPLHRLSPWFARPGVLAVVAASPFRVLGVEALLAKLRPMLVLMGTQRWRAQVATTPVPPNLRAIAAEAQARAPRRCQGSWVGLARALAH